MAFHPIFAILWFASCSALRRQESPELDLHREQRMRSCGEEVWLPGTDRSDSKGGSADEESPIFDAPAADTTAYSLARSSSAYDACAWCTAHLVITGTSAGTDLSAPLPKCAIVGSSSKLRGRQLGRNIDQFSTVIRVNRLPTREFFDDYGSKTDVFFTGAVAKGFDTFTMDGQYYSTFGGDRRLCKYNSSCPFKSVVLKGSDKVECGMDFSRRFPSLQPGWAPPSSTFSVARQSEAVNTLAYNLLGWKEAETGPRPTNGLQAFLWAILACEELSVFGFSGTGTADNHSISHIHNLDKEHALMRSLVKGELGSELVKFLPECASCFMYKVMEHRIRR